jgi:hypothetical protein
MLIQAKVKGCLDLKADLRECSVSKSLPIVNELIEMSVRKTLQ